MPIAIFHPWRCIAREPPELQGARIVSRDAGGAPLPASRAVEQVAPQRMARREARVVEVAGGVALQADPLHHRARAPVPRHREGDDLVEPESLEAEGERRARGLGGVAPSPVLAREAPADLDRGCEGSLEVDVREADEAREGDGTGGLEREEPEAEALEVRLDAVGERIAL